MLKLADMRRPAFLLAPALCLGLLAGSALSRETGQEKAPPPQTPPQVAAPAAPPAGAAVPSAQDSRQETTVGDIKVIAETKERTKDRVIAVGNVEVRYKELALFADRVELDPEKKDVVAEGHVVLQSPQEVLSAERASFNLDSSRGELVNVFGMLQPSLYYETLSVEKKADNFYSLDKGRITTCAQPVPRWDFRFSRADFKKDDYMAMWNMVLAVKKVPVFYFPYFRYPLNRERATGFLTPQAGFSGPKGFIYSQSFYWAISRSMDATLTGDYYSSRGLGGGLEYRYLFSEGSGGGLNLYYFKFKDDPKRTTPGSAHIIRLNHNQTLPLDFKLVANVDYQSSFDFLREFDNNFQRAVISNRSSQVYLSRGWSNFNLNVRVSRFETYFTEQANSILSLNLPQVSFSSFKIKVFEPVYFSLGSGLNRWEYGWNTAFKAGTQNKGQSFWLTPSLSVPFTAIPWLTLNTSAAMNVTYYFQSYAPWGKQVVDEPLLTQNYNLNLELIGPVFFRIFRGADGEPRLKHVIEPSVGYRFDSPIDRSDRIITTRGYFTRYHQLAFGLTNRVFVKQDGMPREVVTLGLAETFYLDPEESPLQIYTYEGKIPRFSDVGSYLRFYPSRDYSVDFSAGFNPYHKTFSSVRFGANLGLPEDDLFLRVSWYKSINPYRKNALFNRHQINAYGGVKLPALDMELEAEVDYNIQDRKLLYSAFSFVYDYQCLQLKAEARVYYFRETPETQFRVSFGLGNIGKSTDILGGIGF